MYSPDHPRVRQISLAILIAGALTLYAMNPSARQLYWPFLLTSYLFGVFVYLRRVEQKGETRTLLGYLFPKEIWLHPSAVNDYMLALLNFALFWLFCRYVFSPDASVFQDEAKRVLDYIFPNDAVSMGEPGLAVTIVYVIAAMLSSEFFFYFAHRWGHTVPLLWEFHKVHHSAEVMTPLTASRLHPIDFFLQIVGRSFGIGIISAIFLFLYPGVKTVDIIAACTVGFGLIFMAGANLQHSHIWLRYPGGFERIVTSPAVHQVHHSKRREHIDRNFGTILSFWDWVFGSLYIPSDAEEGFAIGVPDGEVYRGFFGLYILPLKKAGQRLRRMLTNN